MNSNRRCALIVIDLLEDYFDGNLWSRSQIPELRNHLVETTNELVRAFRDADQPIVWVRQEFEPDLSDAYPHMKSKGLRYTVRDTPGAQLLHELDVQARDRVIVKKRFSAFFNTDLSELLGKLNASRLFLAGITSSWCLRSTAVDAYQLGYEIVLVDECISGFTQDAHEAAMSEMDGYIARRSSLNEAVSSVQSLAQHAT